MKVVALLLAGVLAPSVSQAASSEWIQATGARLRLVTEEAADAAGLLQGVLQIELEPGWKTYWKDPGDAGIPPQIDVSASMNVASASLSFPAPGRFAEGGDMSVGYSQPVDLPVTFKVADPAMFTAIDADVFLGICKEICVPVQARLSVTPAGMAAETDPAISAALAALPAPASAEFGVSGLRDEGEFLVAQASLPAGATEADLFVAAPAGWVLRQPVADTTGATAGFRIPVVSRPAGAGTVTRIDYTLVAAGKAVDGRVDLR